MPTVRQIISRQFSDGTLTAASEIIDVPGIGPYLAQRLREAVRAPAALTVGALWRATRRRTTEGVRDFVRRAVQNARANQCVARGRGVRPPPATYHVGDINVRGYEAVLAVLDRNHANATYGRLMPARLPPRNTASTSCGCRAMNDCNGTCRPSDDGRACVPARETTRGFDGIVRYQSQREDVSNARRVRRASHSPKPQASARDAHSLADAQAGHTRPLAYDARGSRLWRRPSTRVRHPRR